MDDTTTSGIREVPDVVLFTVGTTTLDAASAVASLPPSELARLTSEVVRGQAARHLGEVGDDVRRDTERAFRGERHLVAAEEMERWLAAWHLGVGAWRAQLRRQAALAAHADRIGQAPSVDAGRTDGHVDDEMLWAALVCTGVLRDHAHVLARRMAAAEALGHDPAEADDQHVSAWLADAVGEAQVDRELGERSLEWLRVRWSRLRADDVEAAREARLCLDDDDLPVQRVAAMLGHPEDHGEGWLHAAPAELRDALLGTEVGRTSAPLPREPGHDLVRVWARERPDADDRRVREAVRARLAEQALDLEVRDRVLWHVDF